jgi:hypothetical protein
MGEHRSPGRAPPPKIFLYGISLFPSSRARWSILTRRMEMLAPIWQGVAGAARRASIKNPAQFQGLTKCGRAACYFRHADSLGTLSKISAEGRDFARTMTKRKEVQCFERTCAKNCKGIEDGEALRRLRARTLAGLAKEQKTTGGSYRFVCKRERLASSLLQGGTLRNLRQAAVSLKSSVRKKRGTVFRRRRVYFAISLGRRAHAVEN